MAKPRLLEVWKITAKIVVETGLRIGAAQETMEISGLDNPIIRNPANSEPYIPGSSLKGRMRSLAEWCLGELPQNGDVVQPLIPSDTSHVFGRPARDTRKETNPNMKAAYEAGPTRLVVRDCPLSEESRERFRRGEPLTEVKTENSINRLTCMANPRPMERVLPDVAFDMEMVYRIFDIDGDGGEKDRKLFDKVVLTALALVQADALGSCGSRGCGKVRFEDLKVNGETKTLPNLEILSQLRE